MGKDGFMTPKAIANRIKAKGLMKLKFYCQICQKSCRDENGFKCHTMSESHQRQMLLVAQSPGKFIHSFSDQFKNEFVSILSRRHGTKRVFANQVYQEYIADRHHLHMNATRWNSLSEFVKHLGREGICHVDETERGWYITWIDNSPKALARQAAIQKMDRMQKDDEEREQQLLNEQIEKAKKSAEERGEMETQQATELKRDEAAPIKLSLSLKPAAAPAATEAPKAMNGNKMKMMMKKPGGLSALAKKSAFGTSGASGASESSTPHRSNIMIGTGLGKRKSSEGSEEESSSKKNKTIPA
ncbi:domain of Kin17 curved DNA-binding protein-domain-containing protein [Radiomyces spectabilis]|uniref:domain of Kin17 curved DNA-binding protein-domain-containing protein n=1 Tax=Radiomyces spectabilis TaxID=64574 RepID=UPI00221F6B00|nr:domain of Kin17 curved DNA-binding protein-domain-containing protein [Radiomyces spectabilis]KAI8393579.1 domain of Kin17 curved DNA-binding protein-domain-containing protein [Radiomyces spectabilis]